MSLCSSTVASPSGVRCAIVEMVQLYNSSFFVHRFPMTARQILCPLSKEVEGMQPG